MRLTYLYGISEGQRKIARLAVVELLVCPAGSCDC
jgi:hypothetical protein